MYVNVLSHSFAALFFPCLLAMWLMCVRKQSHHITHTLSAHMLYAIVSDNSCARQFTHSNNIFFHCSHHFYFRPPRKLFHFPRACECTERATIDQSHVYPLSVLYFEAIPTQRMTQLVWLCVSLSLSLSVSALVYSSNIDSYLICLNLRYCTVYVHTHSVWNIMKLWRQIKQQTH